MTLPLFILLMTRGVATYPGQSALILIPCGANAIASALVNPTTACLLVAYAVEGTFNEGPTIPYIDAVLTIEPRNARSEFESLSCFNIWRICALWHSHTPAVLTASTR